MLAEPKLWKANFLGKSLGNEKATLENILIGKEHGVEKLSKKSHFLFEALVCFEKLIFTFIFEKIHILKFGNSDF